MRKRVTPLPALVRPASAVAFDATPSGGVEPAVVRTQTKRRAFIGVPLLALLAISALAGAWPTVTGRLAISLAVYVAFLGLAVFAIRGVPQSANVVAAFAVLADAAIIVAAVVVTDGGGYYERILILSFLVIYSAEACYGRRFALLALVAVSGMYATLVLVQRDQMSAAQELISGALFVTAGATYIGRAGSVRRRLRVLASLFERAEQGDLAGTYAVDDDLTPDAITQLGRSYNRVREQLESMVLTDPLTACLNRRGFDQAMAREVARSRRAGSMIALLALDIDHFKNVNDTHGHQAGDDVLREAAGLLLQGARAGDVVCRLGGEEFALLLPDTDARGAFQLAARICELVRSHEFSARGAPARLTASIGIAAETPARGVDTGALLASRADEAMYAAKRGGRDRVRAWSPEARARRSGEVSSLE